MGLRHMLEKARRLCGAYSILLLVICSFLFPRTALSQSVSWSGYVTCQLNDQEAGAYNRQETQTWTLIGGGPMSPNGMPVYAATWTASGTGSLQRVQGAQTTQISWTTNVPGAPARIAIFVRASDSVLIIKPFHSQLRWDYAINGQRQVMVNGVVQSPSQFSRAVWEWQFPRIEANPGDSTVAGSIQSQGDSGTAEIIHHPGGVPPATVCQWQFTKGGSNSTPVNNQNGMGSQNPGQTPATNGTNNQQGQSWNQTGNSGSQNPGGQPSNTNGTNNTQTSPPASQNTNTSSQNTGGQSSNTNATNNSQSSPPLSGQNGNNGSQNATGSSGTNPSTTQNPASPTNVIATAGNGSATVNWTAPANNGVAIASYRVQVLPNGPVMTVTGSPVNVTGLANGSPYIFQVVAASAQGGESSPAYSNAVIPAGASSSTTTTTGTTSAGNTSTGSSSTSSAGSSSTGSQGLALQTLQTPSITHVASVGTLVGVSPNTNNGQQNVNVALSGQFTHFTAGATSVSFVRSATTQSGTTSALTAKLQTVAAGLNTPPSLQVGGVQVSSNQSLTVPLTINPSAAAGSYNVTVTTPVSNGTETVTLNNAFTVTATPSLSGVNITSGTVPKNIGSTAPPAPSSGTYLVTMTGLMCMRAISSDDAVYGAAVIRQYDRRNGQSTMFTNANTWVYGDTNGMINQRKQAGTRGPMGGIGAGNFVPDGFIVGPKDTLPPQPNLFPMLLWQGTMTDGIDALVISPSLWINYGDNSMFFSWNQNEDSLTNSIYLDTHVQNQINTQTFGILSFGASQNVSGSAASTAAGDNTIVAAETIFQAAGLTFGIPVGVFTAGPTHDRPIGVTPASSDPTSTTILPNATLVLTREMIEKHLGSNGWTIIPFDFRDSPASFSILPGADRPGEYQMFIQIERQ